MTKYKISFITQVEWRLIVDCEDVAEAYDLFHSPSFDPFNGAEQVDVRNYLSGIVNDDTE